jgi:NADPH2:quinone reductase
MRAWLLDSYDGIDTLGLGEVPDPRPGSGDVLVNVRFAALNPADAFLARAMYPANPLLPHILGRDGVGVVMEGHPSVTNVRIGDMVGILRGDAGVETWGTLAEKVVVPAASLVPIPPGWSAEEMAGAPLVFLTAWQALSQWSEPSGPPPKRSVLLVTGASGGVGVASVLLGRSMDLVVVALSRSAEKAATLTALGADFVFDPGDPQLRKRVQAAVAPKKIDLIIDSIGARC